MPTPVIVIEQLGKRYPLAARRADRGWRAALAALRPRVQNLRESAIPRDAPPDHIWALRDVSLSIQPGEVVGFVGRNGAGKSTLLKILARVVTPTVGRAVIHGRVGSLLEVGTGFHPELTGRENIYLNGALLGLRRAEIRRVFDEIVAFADVGPFLDTPVKRYSSGMYVRLAFAVAAHLDPEVLIVDEVLAVGDMAFQRKCLGKMQDIARGGRTVLFVSHNVSAVRALCTRALLLERGCVSADAAAPEVIATYLAACTRHTADCGAQRWAPEAAPGDDEVRLRAVRLIGPDGRVQRRCDVNQPLQVEITYELRRSVADLRVTLQVSTADGIVAFASTDHEAQPAQRPVGEYRSTCTIPARLLNVGSYILHVGLGVPGVRRIVPAQPVLRFETIGVGNQGSRFVEDWPGAVCPRLQWHVLAPSESPAESAPRVCSAAVK